MNNQQLQIFENPDFGKISAVEIDGIPWFVGIEVATVLGYSNTRNAIIIHVDEDDRKNLSREDFEKFFGTSETLGSKNPKKSRGGRQNTILINESGLYALIFGSQLPAAKSFKNWITHEVIPAIRKTGFYQRKSVQTPDTPLFQNPFELLAFVDKKFHKKGK